MTAISVSSRPSSPPVPRRLRLAGGFTLLELLVVLLLLGLLTGVVAPAGWRALENAQRRGVVADLRSALNTLPVRAFQQGAALRVDGPALRGLVPDLPASARLELKTPLEYGINGMAGGGTVVLRFDDGGASTFTVAAITGAVEVR